MGGATKPRADSMPVWWRPVYQFLVQCKWPVIAATTFGFFYNHDVPTFVFVIGAFVCSFLAKIGKKVIRQPRPVNLRKKGAGMPSSHASTLYYMATFISFAIIFSESVLLDPLRRAVLFGLVQLLAFGMAAVRYTEKYHTIPQLLAGALLGCSFASAWYLLATTFINPFIHDHLVRIQMRWLGFVIVE